MKIRGYYLAKDLKTNALEMDGVIIIGKDYRELAYKIIKGEESRGKRFFRLPEPCKKYEN